MITSAINNREFWTASLQITVLVMILTIPVLLTDAMDQEVAQEMETLRSG